MGKSSCFYLSIGQKPYFYMSIGNMYYFLYIAICSNQNKCICLLFAHKQGKNQFLYAISIFI